MLLEETIEEFLSSKKKYMGYDEKMVRNLLQVSKKYSLLEICGYGEI
ncbi:hypothetical protein HYG86_14765 [Alkalicella caledoniensis]|uniref:Uncharacterized protein n=1 Tax=Alkalicella caledoniensis TaxID=2731377 RepID=A0A7G9WB76_ALKCA|nr:hypothetical protein [Alkalicella caledoniensis]QNO15938.1 hypothetical protein HYG86_14765 [Alkalicella caledoniensis]